MTNNLTNGNATTAEKYSIMKIKENDKHQARMDRGREYDKLLEKVLFLYNETSCSVEQIAHHYDISPTTACRMINNKYPQYYKDYLDATL